VTRSAPTNGQPCQDWAAPKPFLVCDALAPRDHHQTHQHSPVRQLVVLLGPPRPGASNSGANGWTLKLGRSLTARARTVRHLSQPIEAALLIRHAPPLDCSCNALNAAASAQPELEAEPAVAQAVQPVAAAAAVAQPKAAAAAAQQQQQQQQQQAQQEPARPAEVEEELRELLHPQPQRSWRRVEEEIFDIVVPPTHVADEGTAGAPIK
jgi:hypothetical protein